MAFSDRLRRNRFPDEEKRSVFGGILDWLLAPLLLIWLLSAALMLNFAHDIAGDPYDQALAEKARLIAGLVTAEGRRSKDNLQTQARALLPASDADTVYFQVVADKLVAGDAGISLPPGPLPAGGGDGRSRAAPAQNDVAPNRPAAAAAPPTDQIHFRDDDVAGNEVRVAWLYVTVKPDQAPVLVQVAETRNKRRALAGKIMTGTVLPQFALVPIAVLLVWIGLGRGLRPLNRLGGKIRARLPFDLSPISTGGVPEEIKPIIFAFNDMMARLEQNLLAQQRFIGDAAHQMRTPLTGLKMQTELALTETDPENMRILLRQIAESTDRAAHLINQLLSLARAEASSKKTHAIECVNLESLARKVTQEWMPEAVAKQIDLGFENTGWPLRIEGNPVLLRELLNNLIDNAIKYTPRGGRVTVRTRAGEFAIVEVEDNGPGIPEQERPLVFERFYRILGNEASGSGLGLPIAREIAELHRGEVRLAPNPHGPGTVAQAVFPRQVREQGSGGGDQGSGIGI